MSEPEGGVLTGRVGCEVRFCHPRLAFEPVRTPPFEAGGGMGSSEPEYSLDPEDKPRGGSECPT
jgi:hypothetical protein